MNQNSFQMQGKNNKNNNKKKKESDYWALTIGCNQKHLSGIARHPEPAPIQILKEKALNETVAKLLPLVLHCSPVKEGQNLSLNLSESSHIMWVRKKWEQDLNHLAKSSSYWSVVLNVKM